MSEHSSSCFYLLFLVCFLLAVGFFFLLVERDKVGFFFLLHVVTMDGTGKESVETVADKC